MKYTLTLLTLLIGCAPEPKHPTVDVHSLRLATVALVQPTKPTKAYCTGVWISKYDILTAAHCVDSNREMVAYVQFADVYDGTDPHPRKDVVPSYAEVVSSDTDHDLALLHVDVSRPHTYVRVGLSAPEVGARLRAIGHGLGLLWTYTSGECTGVRYRGIEGPEMLWVQADVPVSPGSSGGGLFNETGELVGITSGSYPKGQLVNFFVHPTHIRDFISHTSKEHIHGQF